jgi:hypothetical protein
MTTVPNSSPPPVRFTGNDILREVDGRFGKYWMRTSTGC